MTRYVLPRDPVNPSVPLSDEPVRQERQHIQALLPRLIAGRRPDIILLGRESYALHVPDIASAYSIPTIMMVPGGTTNGILGGGYPSEIAAEYLAGQHSLVAIPLFDDGVALNMIIQTSEQPDAFDCERLPEFVWMSNLFGRATHNLVLREELQEAYDRVDLELKVIADIQRSLLPAVLPQIPTMDLAVEYKTAHRAGGDYYDFFPLPGGRWGILIADVSGHGTPAAVMMAITHTIAHGTCELPECPAEFLRFLNERLVCRYTAGNGSFVTAFYGVYDPTTRSLAYSNAGHNPPRVRRCAGGPVFALDNARSLPLGIDAGVEYEHDVAHFVVDDQIIFYTDGITDAPNSRGERFGSTRLDKVLSECRPEASGVIGAVLEAVDRFADGTPADDDQTLLIAKIR
ncbi:MAG: PP2C family protein-serine/threonine phosphatase [Planctomycetes bacterium]|nr:PP2C family protein-serine/threonine phosphatase [Planctomycetota bacterium]